MFQGVLSGKQPAAIAVKCQELTGGVHPEVEISPARADLTDWTEIWLTGKSSLSAADDAAELKLTRTGGGISLVDPARGEGNVTITPDDYAASLPYDKDRRLHTDLQGRDGSGRIHTLATGVIVVHAEATRSV